MWIRKLLTCIGSYWAPCTLFLLAAITVVSLSPLPRLPETAPGDDKTLHFIAYAALVFPVSLRRPKYWGWLGLFFMAYSGIIEVLQPYVNRHGEWVDLAANTTGLVCGLLAASALRRLSSVRF